MNDVELSVEGALIAIVLRVIFRYDADLWIAVVCGATSRLATMYYGPAFVPPDWWYIELVISAAVTMALLGAYQIARANLSY